MNLVWQSLFLFVCVLAPGFLFSHAFRAARTGRSVTELSGGDVTRELVTAVFVAVGVHLVLAGTLLHVLDPLLTLVWSYAGGLIEPLDTHAALHAMLPNQQTSDLSHVDLIERISGPPVHRFLAYVVLTWLVGVLTGRWFGLLMARTQPACALNHGLKRFERADDIAVVDVLVTGGCLYRGIHNVAAGTNSDEDGALHLTLPSRLAFRIPSETAKPHGSAAAFVGFKPVANRDDIVDMLRPNLQFIASTLREYERSSGQFTPPLPESDIELLEQLEELDDDAINDYLRTAIARDESVPMLSIPWGKVENIHVRPIALESDIVRDHSAFEIKDLEEDDDANPSEGQVQAEDSD